jgi:CDP-4-dehydro-6-deoxyglucose reductase, E3
MGRMLVTVEDVEFTVIARLRRTPVIVELELRPVGTPLAYLPGQHVLLGDLDYRIPVRSYSIANAPAPTGRVTVLITRVDGGETSTWLHDRVRVDDSILVSGPYGTFVLGTDPSPPVLALAAGSGLAPIRALAEQVVFEDSGRPFTVLLSARTDADVMDADLFASWSRRHRGLRFLRTLTRAEGDPPVGHVPELLPGLFADLSGHEVYVAGGPGFVSACAQVCRTLSVAPGRLHTEEFFAEPRPWTAPTVSGMPS